MDRIKEQIKFNTEIIRLIVVLFVATGGGTISIILSGLPTATHGVMAVAGMIIAIICIVMTFLRYKVTQSLINKLPYEK